MSQRAGWVPQPAPACPAHDGREAGSFLLRGMVLPQCRVLIGAPKPLSRAESADPLQLARAGRGEPH